MIDAPRMHMLLFRCGHQRCALPVGDVSEIMRPQPVTSVSSSAGFIEGMSLIRGQPVPVIAVSRLLDADVTQPPSRYIVVRIAQRRVALAVSEVTGLRELNQRQLLALPPLLSQAAPAITGLEVLDQQLLVVLGCARLLSAEQWDELAQGAAG